MGAWARSNSRSILGDPLDKRGCRSCPSTSENPARGPHARSTFFGQLLNYLVSSTTISEAHEPLELGRQADIKPSALGQLPAGRSRLHSSISPVADTD